MSATNRQPGNAPGVPLEARMWNEGPDTPTAITEREDALMAMIQCKTDALTIRDEEIAQLKARIAELEATPQPVEVRVIDARIPHPNGGA